MTVDQVRSVPGHLYPNFVIFFRHRLSSSARVHANGLQMTVEESLKALPFGKCGITADGTRTLYLICLNVFLEHRYAAVTGN